MINNPANNSDQSQQKNGYENSYSNTDGGISQFISKAATGAGLVAQQPELSHLVSTVRQEWDPQMQSY